RRFSRTDPLASTPAFAMSYHTPPSDTPEYYAMGLLDQVLLQGDDALLKQELVNRRGYTGDVDGGINFLGHMLNAQTPLLWTAALFHDSEVSPDAIVEASDAVIEPVRETPLDAATFERALVKTRSGVYRTLNMSGYPHVGRVDLLCCFELFEGDAGLINDIDRRFRELTPELVRDTAHEYLRPTNRNVLALEPGAAS